jgi:putative ABC transport system permease protein
MMKKNTSISIALKSLVSHKLRSFLALLGIIIGISSVMIMVAIGEGAKKKVIEQIEGMGENLISVCAGEVVMHHGRPRTLGQVSTLKLKDAKAIEEEISSVAKSAPTVEKTTSVKYENLTTKTIVMGTVPDFFSIKNFELQSGRLFTEEDVRVSKRVAVLGKSVEINLFENKSPLGRIIRINKIPFSVIGVLEPKGIDALGQDEDDRIVIPLTTAMRRVFNVDYLNTIYLQARDEKEIESCLLQVKNLLREKHKLAEDIDDDFTILTQMELLETKKETSTTFTFLIAGVAAISLLVGGIGIMAVMLVSVKERTREIGVRRAVGATVKDILYQFLTESITLSLGGGIIGIIIGILVSFIITKTTEWTLAIPWFISIIAVVISTFIGLLFGVYPAKKAVDTDPIQALRFE